MPEANESTNTANIPETLQCAEISVTVDTTETLDSPETSETIMTPEVSDSQGTSQTPKNQETLSRVVTATESLPAQGVKTPQSSSQIMAPPAPPLPTVDTGVLPANNGVVFMSIDESNTHSADEAGINAGVSREEPIVPLQSGGGVGGAALAAGRIMPSPAPLLGAVYAKLPPADDSEVAMSMDKSNMHHLPPSGEPQASESVEISLGGIEKGKAKEGEEVQTLTAHGTSKEHKIPSSKPIRLSINVSQFQGLFKKFR